jgi:phosphoethanolamine N-methyltransferase|tara:strand:+ start:3450 stop:4241 length:792 start_codon:yes stop_codon:yes gene_type:complete
MEKEDEYHDNMVAMLELIWGEGYMAPGGSGNVAKMLHNLETRGKRILDIGCGIGGPAIEMASTFGADVVGIDLETSLVRRAEKSAEQHGLSDRCRFQTVEVGSLPFADCSFDIVVSAGAITQTRDKEAILSECFRVLQPGGYLSCYDWNRSDSDYSEDMYYWFKMEGLTYALETLDDYATHFRHCGFIDIETQDASDWYRVQASHEYDLVKGDLYQPMVELLGQESADHFVENWRAMVVVCNKGEMRQGYSRGRRAAGGELRP